MKGETLLTLPRPRRLEPREADGVKTDRQEPAAAKSARGKEPS